MSMTLDRSATYGSTKSTSRVVLALIASANGTRLIEAMPERSRLLARSSIQEVTSESAGPPWGGLYLKPPSRGRIVRGSDDDAVAPVGGAAGIIDQDRVRDHRRRRHSVVALQDRLDAARPRALRGPSAAPGSESACVSFPMNSGPSIPFFAGSRRSPA